MPMGSPPGLGHVPSACIHDKRTEPEAQPTQQQKHRLEPLQGRQEGETAPSETSVPQGYGCDCHYALHSIIHFYYILYFTIINIS